MFPGSQAVKLFKLSCCIAIFMEGVILGLSVYLNSKPYFSPFLIISKSS